MELHAPFGADSRVDDRSKSAGHDLTDQLKSLAATMRHGEPTKIASLFSSSTVPRPASRLPSMNQVCVSFVSLLCQRMSDTPSPPKSPAATTRQGGPMKTALPSSPNTVPRPISRL